MKISSKNKSISWFYFFALVFFFSWQRANTQKLTPEDLKPVNIVLFIADDLGARDVGAYMNNEVHTPNIDKLAKESMLFKNAFAASPTCSPSRSAIFTGLMPFRNGAHGNHMGVRKETKSIVHYLEPLGYKVAIAGKYHVGPEANFPFERIANTNVAEPGFEEHPGLNYDLNVEPVDKWLMLQKGKKPFLLVVADHSPHVVWPEKTSYKQENVAIPPFHIDTKETRQSRARYYQDISKMDENLGKLLSSLKRNNLEDNTMVVFISDQGPQWAFGKWSLYDYGVRSPLLIRWKGKVKNGSSSEALVSLVDLLPTFLEIVGGKAQQEIDGNSFLQVLFGEKDTHREFVFASHTGDGTMNRSPSRMIRNHRYKYILNLAPEIRYTTHIDKAKDHDGGREYWNSWREKSFRDEHAANVLLRYHNKPKEELYDLEADPNEMHNLIGLHKYDELLSNFRGQLSAWRKTQEDYKTGPEVASKKETGVSVPYKF